MRNVFQEGIILLRRNLPGLILPLESLKLTSYQGLLSFDLAKKELLLIVFHYCRIRIWQELIIRSHHHHVDSFLIRAFNY